MFWRNNYLNDETLQTYLKSTDRSHYTYSESSSYRERPSNNVAEQPKMFRQTIHTNNLINSVENGGSVMSSKSNSTVTTPKSRNKYLAGSNNRVLRSRRSIISSGKTETFVSEGDFEEEDSHKSYRAGALNSNSNNSGPDNEEDIWKTQARKYDYNLSADEDLASDSEPVIVEQRANFDSDNVNVRSAPKRTFNQWFQKNMFGLPNDESDDAHPDFSGAISGDEQYDIASFKKSKTFQKSKSSKFKSKKSSRSDSQLSKSDSVLCSPVAVVSYMFEYMWLVVVTITSVFSRSWSSVTRYSNCPKWYLLPFYLPSAVASTLVYGLATSTDRLLGTNLARRLLTPSSNNKKWSFFSLLLKTLWLLLWMTVAFIAMHLVFSSHSSEMTTSNLLPDLISESLYNFVGKDCMEDDDCCHNKWEFVKRFSFCMASLPTRLIISKYQQNSNDHKESQIIIKSNISDLNDILYQIQARLKAQEELLKKYYTKMSILEKDSLNKDNLANVHDKKILNLNKEMNTVMNKLGRFQSDLKEINVLKGNVENFVKKSEDSNQKSLRLITGDIEKLRKKLEEDMKMVQSLIVKSDNSAKNNLESTKVIELLLGRVQEDLLKLTARLNDIHSRTTSLEVTSEKLVYTSSSLKKEILEEISKEMNIYKSDQNVLTEKMNVQMSKLEETLNKDYAKLLEDAHLNSLIEAQLESLESNVVNNVNSTLWINIKDHVQHLLASLSSGYSHIHGASERNVASKSCRCPVSLCRRKASCLRLSQVRKMLTDALNLYSADKIGLADFALESAGGTIATIRCTETYTDRAATLTIFGIPLLRLTNAPRTIIQPSINPGECWAMKGNKGSVVVQLSGTVVVNAVSIDHIPKSLSPSGTIDSAIRDFEIKALNEINASAGLSLGNFTYNIESSSVQTFSIKNPTTTSLVEMIIHSNYGNEEYTCIYRLRVHGTLVT